MAIETVTRSTHHILLIEDNPGDELLLREALSRTKYNSICNAFDSGEAALEFLNRKVEEDVKNIPDLILMDLTLPRMDGFELLRIIKSDPALKSIPLVIFSGSDRPEDVKKAFDFGANGYVTKPTGLKRLEDKVRMMEEYWFEKKRASSDPNETILLDIH